MPLGRCNRCGNKLRFGSAVCSYCGTKKPRLKYIFAGIVVVQACVIAFYLHYQAPGGIHVVVSGPSSQPSIGPAADAKPPTGWLYFDTRDDLIGDVTRHARLISRSNLATGLTAGQGSEGVLELRASPTYGRSALVTLRIQASDAAAENSELHMQFDGGELAVFQSTGTADSTNLTFVIQDAAGFTARLKAASVLSLEALLPQNRQRVAIFDVAGLKWD